MNLDKMIHEMEVRRDEMNQLIDLLKELRDHRTKDNSHVERMAIIGLRHLAALPSAKRTEYMPIISTDDDNSRGKWVLEGSELKKVIPEKQND